MKENVYERDLMATAFEIRWCLAPSFIRKNALTAEKMRIDVNICYTAGDRGKKKITTISVYQSTTENWPAYKVFFSPRRYPGENRGTLLDSSYDLYACFLEPTSWNVLFQFLNATEITPCDAVTAAADDLHQSLRIFATNSERHIEKTTRLLRTPTCIIIKYVSYMQTKCTRNRKIPIRTT